MKSEKGNVLEKKCTAQIPEEQAVRKRDCYPVLQELQKVNTQR